MIWKTALMMSLSLSLVTAPVTPAQASLLSVKEVVTKGDSISQRVLGELDKPEARAQVEAMGLSFDEARSRIAGMSEQELQRLVKSNGVQEAGGDIVIGLTTVLLIVIIVLLLR